MNDDGSLEVLDQIKLPFEKTTKVLRTTEEVVTAIQDMTIRGAGTISSVAAYGVAIAAREAGGDKDLFLKKAKLIRDSRPTAVNLMWAVDRMVKFLENSTNPVQDSLDEATRIVEGDCSNTEAIGRFGYDIMKDLQSKKGGGRINVLTHCNAGWLAIQDLGTALAPVYEAHKNGMDVHVWVDETRPRNQGASLTSWELKDSGVPHTVIADNTGGLLMMRGMVDLVITGADRVTANGDVANKIGTYLKALAASDNNVPFYVAIPGATLDLNLHDGMNIPIEERSEEEVTKIRGKTDDGKILEVQVTPDDVKAMNLAFDVTPARLITGLITEKGVCKPDTTAIRNMYPDGV